MKYSSILLIIAGLICLQSCATNCITAEGDIVQKAYTLEGFNEIKNNSSADVELTQSKNEKFSVVVATEENIQESVTVEVNKDGTLIIDTEGCIMNSKELTVYVTMPRLSKVTVNGSGDISTTNTFQQEQSIYLLTEGSGDLKIELHAPFVSASVDGSGDIKLKGKADELVANIDGSGDIKAFNLNVNRAKAIVDGSGDIEVSAKNQLDAMVDGSGDIKYKNTPTLETEIDGSGDIIQIK